MNQPALAQATAQIVSPPLPTGVSWLVNCLLELGIRAQGYGAHWQDGPDGSGLLPAQAREQLLWTLPVLHRQGRFDFAEPLTVVCEHLLGCAQFPARKTILFVRDLRDTLYSHFQRKLFNSRELEMPGLKSRRFSDSEADFRAYLRQAEIWPLHFGYLFDLPPADTLACFYLFWLAQVPAEQLLVLRFEDCKRDAAGQLRRVLDFLGLERDSAACAQAIANSDFSHFQAINRTMRERTGSGILISRAGRVAEWKQTFSPEALACLQGPAAEALQALGYEPSPAGAMPWSGAISAEQTAQALAPLRAWLAQGDSGSAEAWISAALAQALPPPLGALLLGQWLGLLWTRAIMGAAQSHLPAASRAFGFFSDFAARYAMLPQLAQAATRLLDSQHPLHFLWPRPQAFVAAGIDLASAVDRARAAGLPYLLWHRAGLRLELAGQLQLCALLEKHLPQADAVIPILAPDAGLSEADFAARALALHARWGAEFASIRPAALPACLLVRLSSLGSIPDPGAEADWLAGLKIYRALGVLARPG